MPEGARVVGIGVGRPGIDTDEYGTVLGRLIPNQEEVDDLAQRREVLKDQLILPDRWDSLAPEDRKNAERAWKQFDSSDAWMVEMSGIKTRTRAAEGITTSDLARVALLKACRSAGWDVESIDGLLIGTVLGDFITTPSTTPLTLDKAGLAARRPDGSWRDISGADITCACTTFLKTLEVGYALVRAGLRQRVVVVGADVMHHTVSLYDRSPRMLLGDGAGALALEASEHDSFLGARSTFSGFDGSQAGLIMTQYGGTAFPLDDPAIVADRINHPHRMRMDGQAVMAYFIRHLPGIILAAAEKAEVTLDQIALCAFHQANLRILEQVMKRLCKNGLKRESVFINIDRYGNATSASIPLVLFDAWKAGRLHEGDLVCAVAMGGGLSWQVMFFHWTLPSPS